MWRSELIFTLAPLIFVFHLFMFFSCLFFCVWLHLYIFHAVYKKLPSCELCFLFWSYICNSLQHGLLTYSILSYFSFNLVASLLFPQFLFHHLIFSLCYSHLPLCQFMFLFTFSPVFCGICLIYLSVTPLNLLLFLFSFSCWDVSSVSSSFAAPFHLTYHQM